jgi:hypothetical protein
VLTTSGTYPWWFVTQIFRSGQPSHGGEGKTFEAMTSSGISNQLRYIYPYACAAGMLLHINGKFTMGKLKSSLFASWKINFFFLSNELSWVYSNVNLPFLPPDIYIHCLDYRLVMNSIFYSRQTFSPSIKLTMIHIYNAVQARKV